MKKFKETQGITLIALVITIIVLLILAGVAISMLAGDNGILKQAVNAKEETEASSMEENIQLVVNEILSSKKDIKEIISEFNLTKEETKRVLILTISELRKRNKLKESFTALDLYTSFNEEETLTLKK